MRRTSPRAAVYLGTLICVVVVVVVRGQQQQEHRGTKEQLLAKWDMKDVLRDVEHIKKDLGTMISLRASGEMSKSETHFYYIRMHDFDDNGKLDGLEIRVALLHTEHHGREQLYHNDTVLTGTIDHALKRFDVNNDGYIDFTEFNIAQP